MADASASSTTAAHGSHGTNTSRTTYVPDEFQGQMPPNVQYAEMDNPNPSKMAVQDFTLPPLPYAYDALEPYISSQIMRLHHDKHHQAYVTGLNSALANYSAAVDANDLPDQINLEPLIRFNGGGHINHSLFWRNLAPADSDDASKPEAVAPELAASAAREFGSFDGLIDAFTKELNSAQGSGWGWLVREDPRTQPGTGGGGLRIVTTKDQDPIVQGEVPIVGVDVWEHAYYLQYENARASYIDAVWNVINWTEAETRYLGNRDEAFETLLNHAASDEPESYEA